MVKETICMSILLNLRICLRRGKQKSLPCESICLQIMCISRLPGHRGTPVTHRMFIILVHPGVIIAFTLNFQFHHLRTSEAH